MSITIDFTACAVNLSVDTFIDFYELLHVQPSAPTPVIKASYRAMMQKLNHHPDRGGDVAFAQLLNQAAETLCNPQTRLHYDALRQQHETGTVSPPAGSSKADKEKKGSWGTPGGTPSGSSEEPAPDDQPSNRQSDDYENHRTGNMPVSVGAHCPFCLATFAVIRTSLNHRNGYAANAMNSDNIAYHNPNRCPTCNGARTPIEHVPRANNEQLRRMHRQLHDSDARLWIKWPLQAPALLMLVDFSPTGCALIHSAAMDTGQIVMMDTELFNAICMVRHCNLDSVNSYRIGLEFLTLDMQATPGALLDASA